MNATKRKFNALLQGIGTRSPGPVSDDSNDALPRPLTGSMSASASASASASTHTPSGSISAQYTTATQPSAPAKMASTTVAAATSSAVANLEFLAKRRRLAEATATLRDTTGNAVVTPSTSASLLRKWGSSATAHIRGSSSTATPATPPPAPRYCPGDREQLLRRLATFQELTDWAPKPDRINEIEWAKRGWVCQGKERLRCTLCNKELVVRLVRAADDDISAKIKLGSKASKKRSESTASTESVVTTPLPSPEDTTEAALVERYAELIVAAHQDSCLWQRKGCDDSLLRLSLASPRQALADLRLRYDELCARKDFLPYEFNLRLPEGLDIDAVLATLPPDFFTNPAAKTPATSTAPNRTALALAVMGWQGLTNSRIGAVPNSASCHACLRRLGLWMFKSKQVDLDTNTVLEPAPMDHLEAVREHRFFCPWRNGAIQRNPGGDSRAGGRGKKNTTTVDVPGWDVLVQVLKNDAYLRNRLLPVGASKRPTTSAAPSAPADTTLPEPTTPVRRPMTSAVATPVTGSFTIPVATPGTGSKSVFGRDSEADAEDEAARDAKDKERWARLRRVKSLFDTKGSRKLKRTGTPSGSGNGSSRPNTSHSARPETGK